MQTKTAPAASWLAMQELLSMGLEIFMNES